MYPRDTQGAILAIFFAGLFLTSALRANVQIEKKQDANGKTVIRLENEFIRMDVVPSNGGRVARFVYKPADDSQWVGGPTSPGLFLDHLWQQSWPGVLHGAEYQYEITSKGPERAEVRLWKVVDSGAGRDTIWGVRYEKVLALERGQALIFCRITLTNTTDVNRSPGLWVQHVLAAGNAKENVYFRPSTRGIDTAYTRYVGTILKKEWSGNDWVKDPVAGWSATVAPAEKLALIMLVDYNELNLWYNSLPSWTMEVFYDQVQLLPGGSWQTELAVVAVEGFESVAYASRKVVADLSGKFAGDTLIVQSTIAAVDTLSHVDLVVAAESASSRRALGSRRIELTELGRSLVAHRLELPLNDPARQEGVVVKVSLQAADDISEAYEIFVPPVEPSVAAAATYSRPRPVKTKRPLDKPEQIELIAHDGFRVFEARGIWFREWQVKEAANRFDDGNVVPGYYQKEVYAETLTKFPISY